MGIHYCSDGCCDLDHHKESCAHIRAAVVEGLRMTLDAVGAPKRDGSEISGGSSSMSSTSSTGVPGGMAWPPVKKHNATGHMAATVANAGGDADAGSALEGLSAEDKRSVLAFLMSGQRHTGQASPASVLGPNERKLIAEAVAADPAIGAFLRATVDRKFVEWKSLLPDKPQERVLVREAVDGQTNTAVRHGIDVFSVIGAANHTTLLAVTYAGGSTSYAGAHLVGRLTSHRIELWSIDRRNGYVARTTSHVVDATVPRKFGSAVFARDYIAVPVSGPDNVVLVSGLTPYVPHTSTTVPGPCVACCVGDRLLCVGRETRDGLTACLLDPHKSPVFQGSVVFVNAPPGTALGGNSVSMAWGNGSRVWIRAAGATLIVEQSERNPLEFECRLFDTSHSPLVAGPLCLGYAHEPGVDSATAILATAWPHRGRSSGLPDAVVSRLPIPSGMKVAFHGHVFGDVAAVVVVVSRKNPAGGRVNGVMWLHAQPSGVTHSVYTDLGTDRVMDVFGIHAGKRLAGVYCNNHIYVLSVDTGAVVQDAAIKSFPYEILPVRSALQ
jgi:hypothetical protein